METKRAQIFVLTTVIFGLLYAMLGYDWQLPKQLSYEAEVSVDNPVKSMKNADTVERPESNRPPNMESYLQFLHPEILQCEDIFELGLQKSELQYIWDNLTEYESIVEQQKAKMSQQESAKCHEGYSAKEDGEAFIMAKLAALGFVKTICETGFNAGHSTLIWLLANPNTKVYSFDLGRHTCTRPMAEYLQKRFPGRLNIELGDSTKTLPDFRRRYPDVKCDLMIVDGGHTVKVASADFDNFYAMSNRLHIVFYDNHPDIYKIGASWEKLKRRGQLTEYFRCQYVEKGFYKKHGFTFGQYIH